MKGWMNNEDGAIKKIQNVVKLLAVIQIIFHGQDETKYSFIALVESNMDLHTARQVPDQNHTEFLRTFKLMVGTIKANSNAMWLKQKLYD